MTKVLLVEDDNNLREIYEARLAAEGYEISTAKDGEDALAVAKQVKPDLIISDVMMPRISGFEMLDILRNTDGLKHVKIIMLTALGQSEDKTRADSLGADRYLVKSQVTLEDIVKAAEELLNPDAAQPAPEPAADVASAPAQTSTFSPTAPPDVAAVAHQPETAQAVPTMPTVSASEPNDNPEAAVTPIPDVPVQPTPAPDVAVQQPAADPAPESAMAPEPQAATPQTTPVTPVPAPVDTTQQDNEPLIQMPPQPVGTDAAVATTDQAQSTSQENAAVAQQIENFVATAPATVPATDPTPEPVTPAPEPQANSIQPTPVTPVDSQGANDTNNDEVIKAAIDNLAAPSDSSPEVVEAPEAPASSTEESEETTEPSVAQIPGKKVITPINDPNASANELETLLAQEQMKEDLEKGTTGSPVVGNVAEAQAQVPEPTPATPTAVQTPPPGGVFTPNESGNANENAL